MLCYLKALVGLRPALMKTWRKQKTSTQYIKPSAFKREELNVKWKLYQCNKQRAQEID